jgi:hypothetical protein
MEPKKVQSRKIYKVEKWMNLKKLGSTSVSKKKVCNYTTMIHISNCAHFTSINIKGDYMVEWLIFLQIDTPYKSIATFLKSGQMDIIVDFKFSIL